MTSQIFETDVAAGQALDIRPDAPAFVAPARSG
jgi:hypothetical protein